MDGHGPLLGVDSRSQFLGGAEKETDASGVHVVKQFLTRVVAVRLLNETDLLFRNVMVFHQLAPDFAVNVPFVRLVRAQVGKHELRALLVEILVVVFRNPGRAVGCLISRIVPVFHVDEAHVKRHLVRVVGGYQHFRLLFRIGQRKAVYMGGVPALRKLYQLLYEHLLVGRGRYMVQLLVEFRPVHTHVLRSLVVGYLRVEIGKFGHFDKVPEPFLLHDLVGHGELKVRAFLGIYGGPTVKAGDSLPFHFSGAKVFEKQVKLGQTVGDGRTRQEGGPQVPTGAFLNGTDGKKQVHRLYASFRVSKSRNPCMAGVEHQVLEIMRFVHEQVVDAHLFEINHVIRPPLDGILQFFKFRLKILLPLFQPAYNPAADLVSLLLEYGKVLLYAFYLLIVYLLLYLR